MGLGVEFVDGEPEALVDFARGRRRAHGFVDGESHPGAE